jgi:CheY-like chemotaxis protein
MRARPAIILYLESNQILARTVQDVLEFAGWYVKPCADDGMAIAMIEYNEYFDLLLVDNDLRGSRDSSTGLEIVRRARRQAHRRRTPIILISLEDCAEEARLAGADAFLRKPNNLIELVDTIRRLLAASDGE